MSDKPLLWSQRGLYIEVVSSQFYVLLKSEESRFALASEVREYLLQQDVLDLKDSTQPVYEWLWAMEKHFNE